MSFLSVHTDEFIRWIHTITYIHTVQYLPQIVFRRSSWSSWRRISNLWWFRSQWWRNSGISRMEGKPMLSFIIMWPRSAMETTINGGMLDSWITWLTWLMMLMVAPHRTSLQTWKPSKKKKQQSHLATNGRGEKSKWGIAHAVGRCLFTRSFRRNV